MALGQNRQGIIVYSYEDVKRLHPSTGSRGMWAFQSHFHDGHKQCAEAAQRCDWVVGMMFNNIAAAEIMLTGHTAHKDEPIIGSDMGALVRYSDVALVLTDDYHPYKNYMDQIREEFEEHFPIECLMEKGILDDQSTYTELYYAVAFRFMVHQVFGLQFDYQAQCGRDRYRVVGYVDYVLDRWGVPIDLLDSVKDEFGNSVSKSIIGLPKKLKDRLNIQLLKPEFTSIDQVREHVKLIDGLKVINFYLSRSWVHASFAFDGYRQWTEGVRRCK
jgi:hypothetical protein